LRYTAGESPGVQLPTVLAHQFAFYRRTGAKLAIGLPPYIVGLVSQFNAVHGSNGFSLQGGGGGKCEQPAWPAPVCQHPNQITLVIQAIEVVLVGSARGRGGERLPPRPGALGKRVDTDRVVIGAHRPKGVFVKGNVVEISEGTRRRQALQIVARIGWRSCARIEESHQLPLLCLCGQRITDLGAARRQPAAAMSIGGDPVIKPLALGNDAGIRNPAFGSRMDRSSQPNYRSGRAD